MSDMDLNYIINKVSKNIERLENCIESKIYDKSYLKIECFYIMGQNNVLGDILVDLGKDVKIYINNRNKLDNLCDLIE